MSTKKETTTKSSKPKALSIKVDLTEKEKKNEEIAKGRKTSYTVKPEEQGHVHVEIEKVEFDVATSSKKSTPDVVIFDTKAWEMARKNLSLKGYSHIRVLHAPKGTNTDVPTIADLMGKEIK